MILVTGSTGLIGSEVVRLLSQAGASARALVRNPNSGHELPGMTWVIGDLAKPDTLPPVFAGCTTQAIPSAVVRTPHGLAIAIQCGQQGSALPGRTR
jgi:uncharacterized protein YbjT (DUF2867 family)